MEKPKLRVLSLFNGISAGLVALEELGFEVEVYYSSEIDEGAMLVSQHNFGTKITEIGSVVDITIKTLDELGPINFLIGGSPCEELSLVNPRGRGLNDCDGTGALFYDFYRILTFYKAKKLPVFYWMYENVFHMRKEYREIIAKFLGSDLIVLNSASISPQCRKRIFCTNIPGIKELEKRLKETTEIGPVLNDYINTESGRKANITKCNTITSKRSCLQDSSSRNPVDFNGKPTSLEITEIEQIFGFPKNFTLVGKLSATKRHSLLGKSWCIQLIKLIFEPLKEIFDSKDL